jgi:hypothetical protein
VAQPPREATSARITGLEPDLAAHIRDVRSGGLLLSVALALVVATAMRLWTVGHFDYNIATTVLTEVGVMSLIFGTALLAFPWVLVWAVTSASFLRIDRPLRYSAVLVGILVVALPLTPLRLTIAGIVVALAGCTLAVYARRHRDVFTRQGWRPLQGLVLAVLAAAFLAVGPLTDDRMLLPAERLDLDGGRSLVAYVLSDDDNEYQVLRHHGRQVETIPATDVADRVICEPGGFWSYIGWPSHVEPC